MKVRIFIFIVLICPKYVPAGDSIIDNLEGFSCKKGSHQQLHDFFTNRNYVVVAQGKNAGSQHHSNTFAEILFLVTPDMAFFHALTLSPLDHGHFNACLFASGREIDFQFASPVPGLFERHNREHQVLIKQGPSQNASCPEKNSSCQSEAEWPLLFKQTYILSAYHYSTAQNSEIYNESVELTIDGKTIRPSRGSLAEHARKKYALRLRNALNESEQEVTTALQTYQQIHAQVDHRLPLIILSVNKDRDWKITRIDRINGLAEIILHGSELNLYPLKRAQYLEFIAKSR